MTHAVQSVLETGIYVDDLEVAKDFYTKVLELSVILEEPGRSLFLRVGPANVLLVFLPEVTRRGGVLPAHGTSGAGHFALAISQASLDYWKSRLREHAVEIELEYTWPRGGTSIYFRDPAGNSVELVTPGIWGLPSGW